jgi:hypothetical protein
MRADAQCHHTTRKGNPRRKGRTRHPAKPVNATWTRSRKMDFPHFLRQTIAVRYRRDQGHLAVEATTGDQTVPGRGDGAPQAPNIPPEWRTSCRVRQGLARGEERTRERTDDGPEQRAGVGAAAIIPASDHLARPWQTPNTSMYRMDNEEEPAGRAGGKEAPPELGKERTEPPGGATKLRRAYNPRRNLRG